MSWRTHREVAKAKSFVERTTVLSDQEVDVWMKFLLQVPIERITKSVLRSEWGFSKVHSALTGKEFLRTRDT